MTEEPADYNTGYYFREFYIRPQMMDAIRRYVDEGLEPGDFLTAVICNDLFGAVNRADDENLRNLPAFVCYFYNDAPSDCHGSRGAMAYWIEKKRKEREAKP